MEKLIKKQTESEKRRTWAERKSDFLQWKKSLSFKKTQALACGITLLVLLVAFLIFNISPGFLLEFKKTTVLNIFIFNK